jgi:hypothetical protein
MKSRLRSAFAAPPSSASWAAKLRFEELEWRHRATRCLICGEVVLARKRHYFPQLQGFLLLLAPLWLPLFMLAQLLPFPWRCAVCGRAQRRVDLRAKEGIEFADAARNTERLQQGRASEDRSHRAPPPKFKPIGVYESLTEKGWFGQEPIINAGVQYNTLADAVSRAAYRGMKPWAVQAVMIAATVVTIAAGFMNGWLSVGVGLALAAWIAAYQGRRRASKMAGRDQPKLFPHETDYSASGGRRSEV